MSVSAGDAAGAGALPAAAGFLTSRRLARSSASARRVIPLPDRSFQILGGRCADVLEIEIAADLQHHTRIDGPPIEREAGDERVVADDAHGARNASRSRVNVR